MSLVLREAVCHKAVYCTGREKWTTHEQNPSIPAFWKVGYTLKPFTDKHNRAHLQIMSPQLDYVLRVLNSCSNEDRPLCREKGENYVKTPCTCVAGLCLALECRQRLIDSNRPAHIPDRHARGFRRELQKLIRKLESIIKAGKPEKPDWRKRYLKYSGTKRAHYMKCRDENEAHPLGTPDGANIFHAGAVKWGELSDRPRALLVQSVRAKGGGLAKPGEILRTPIMIEGGYRDLYEDALHKYMHRRGFHYCASGMDLHRRGRKLRKMIEPGDDVLSCDWSSFDGSLGWLGYWERQEFLYSTRRLFGRDPGLDEVIRTQNFCDVQAGPLRAKIFGNRGSGTAGTSTGNKIVVLAALNYCLGPAMLGNNGVKLFCDGDDTLIIVPRQWQGQRWYDSWKRRLTELGLETKIEQLLHDTSACRAVDAVRFCRAGVVDTVQGPLLMKKPQDALKVMSNIRRHFRGKVLKNYLATLSVCLKNTYGEVPILCELWKAFDVGTAFDANLLESCGMEYMMAKTNKISTLQVSSEARTSFANTWGVPEDVQVSCELALREYAGHMQAIFMRDDMPSF